MISPRLRLPSSVVYSGAYESPPRGSKSGLSPTAHWREGGWPPRPASERDGAAVDEALAGDDLVHDLLRHGPVAGDGHRGQGSVVLRRVVGLAAHGGGDDVYSVLAERRPDASDHARHVRVAEQGDVGLELQVEPLPPRLQQVRACP